MKCLCQHSLMPKTQVVLVLLSMLFFHSCRNYEKADLYFREEKAESSEYYEETEDDVDRRGLLGRVRDEGGGFPEDVVTAWERFDSIAFAPLKIEEYKVVLDVTKIIQKHKSGEFKVWIGSEIFIKEKQDNIVRDTTSFPGTLGQFAKITPYAPDFDIEPKKSECIRIHPSGSSVRFVLAPKEKGEFKVSAIVELFEGVECSGTPIPKSSETLTVLVKVDTKHELLKKIQELFSILWDKFLSFWGLLWTLIFGVVFFLIRRSITKKTGYKDQSE